MTSARQGSSACYFKTDSGIEEGFCVDLAQHLSKLVGFHYKFRVVGDGHYGRPNPLTGRWDGMIGEVMRGVSSMIF